MMESWVKDKIKDLLALPETIEYINNNEFRYIYWDAEEYEADPEIVGNLTYTLLEAGLDPLKLDRVLSYSIPYGYLAYTRIKDFEVPSSINNVGMKAFQSSRLEKFICPKDSQLALLGYKAFNGCQKLKEVYLPESVKDIRSSCFKDCHLLEKINIPAKCILGDDVFFNCYNLNQIEYSGTKDQLIKNSLYKQLIGNGFYINKVNCVDGVFEIK